MRKPPAAKKANESSSSEDSDDENVGRSPAKSTPMMNGHKSPSKENANNAEDSTDTSDSEIIAAKKAKTADPSNHNSSSSSQSETAPNEPGSQNSSGKKVRTPNEPFRRVQLRKEDLDHKFRDNSFNAQHDQWGHKAFKDLSVVQGKGFRHEKTKKKRGSYAGGPINTSVNSIRFDSEED